MKLRVGSQQASRRVRHKKEGQDGHSGGARSGAAQLRARPALAHVALVRAGAQPFAFRVQQARVRAHARVELHAAVRATTHLNMDSAAIISGKRVYTSTGSITLALRGAIRGPR
jgi:hypothetical protein